MSTTKSKTGTREWAVATVNILDGCPHGCRYCYARAMAMRFHRLGARHHARVKGGQTPERIRAIYEALKEHPKIRWKDSYRRVLGLPLAEPRSEER